MDDAERLWDLVLKDACDAEGVFLEQPFAGFKKMALARSLQLQQNESNRLRDHVYNNFTTTEILDMLGGGRAVPAVPAEAAAAVAAGGRA